MGWGGAKGGKKEKHRIERQLTTPGFPFMKHRVGEKPEGTALKCDASSCKSQARTTLVSQYNGERSLCPGKMTQSLSTFLFVVFMDHRIVE